jgi:hypothetical protein
MAAAANEGETRWRLFDNDGHILLAITDTDEPTDNIGSPQFRCRKASGQVEMEGDAKDALRRVVADLIRAGKPLNVSLAPSDSGNRAGMDVYYVEADDGWRYKLHLTSDAALFEQFKRTGTVEFRLNKTLVRETFKVGLENAGKFQDLCKPPRQ